MFFSAPVRKVYKILLFKTLPSLALLMPSVALSLTSMAFSLPTFRTRLERNDYRFILVECEAYLNKGFDRLCCSYISIHCSVC